jgi:phosphate transport system substrate-binding protein
LYIYVNKEPNKPLTPLTIEFLKMVLSESGQEVVVKDGYVAIPAKVINQELNKLQ